jgi:alpha-ketoglutarate-dependent 2,4-dichlorophenoxyacetate dioxygenase
MALAIRKLEEHIGAEVEGVDITALVDASIFAQLRAALYDSSVLVFRGQDITDAQHVAFTRGFGPIELTIPNDPIGDGGPVGILSNLDENGAVIPPQDTRMLYQRGNELWHSDGAFRRVPLRASLLSAKVVPPEGGETEYASLCAAYAALTAEKRAGLEGLAAEHSFAHSRTQIAPNLVDDAFLEEVPPVEHVLVRTIPETGARALLVGSYTTRIIDWPLEKGKSLLQELLEWSTQPRFVYRHQWRAHDLVVWDNRCCLHRGRPWDRRVHRRIMHRTTVAGDGPIYL